MCVLMYMFVCMCVFVCVCVRAHILARVSMCVCVNVCVCVCVIVCVRALQVCGRDPWEGQRRCSKDLGRRVDGCMRTFFPLSHMISVLQCDEKSKKKTNTALVCCTMVGTLKNSNARALTL